jgi:hypothetical protein
MRSCLVLFAVAACGGARPPAAPAPASIPCDEQWRDRLATLTIGPPRVPEIVPPNALYPRVLCGARPPRPGKEDRWTLLTSRRLHVITSVKVCVSERGEVRTSLVKSSGLPRWDGELKQAIATWRFVPIVAGGETVPSCTAITFLYDQRPMKFTEDEFAGTLVIQWR